tara:strand:+ start:680 stop:1186 length:507 start_codon:yes stop_codon:yes gene_type:complete
MAVLNKYVNSDLEADKNAPAFQTYGDKTLTHLATFETAAADDDGSVFRIIKNVPADLIPVSMEIFCDTLTGSTDWDIGFYEPTINGVDGAVIDVDKLTNTIDLATAITRANAEDGLQTLDPSELLEPIYVLAGHTLATKLRGYDIAFTANTIGSGVGTISVITKFVQS